MQILDGHPHFVQMVLGRRLRLSADAKMCRDTYRFGLGQLLKISVAHEPVGRSGVDMGKAYSRMMNGTTADTAP